MRAQIFNAIKYSTAFPVIIFSAMMYQVRCTAFPPTLSYTMQSVGLLLACGGVCAVSSLMHQ